MSGVEALPPSPMGIYNNGADLLLGLAAVTKMAASSEKAAMAVLNAVTNREWADELLADAAESAYTAALYAEDAAWHNETSYVSTLLEQIHLAGSRERVNTAGYLQAVGLTETRGSRAAVASAHGLTRMERRTARGNIPVAVVGAVGRILAVGMSAGGVTTERYARPGQPDGLGLIFPLTRLHTYGLEAPIDYKGHDTSGPHPVHVRHALPMEFVGGVDKAKMASTARPAETYPEAYERVITNTGMAPFIAYGGPVVAIVLKGVVNFNSGRPESKLSRSDLAATAVNLGIDPSLVVGHRLAQPAVLLSFIDSVRSLVTSQVGLGEMDASYVRPDFWPAGATREVMQYVDNKDMLTSVIRIALSEIYATTIDPNQAALGLSAARVAEMLGAELDVEIDVRRLCEEA